MEKKLGIEPASSSSAGSSKAAGAPSGDPPVLAGRKHRFDDTEYLEQSKELVDGVKSAVSIGKSLLCCIAAVGTDITLALLKKRKKAKLGPSSAPAVEKTSLADQTPPLVSPAAQSVEAIGA